MPPYIESELPQKGVLKFIRIDDKFNVDGIRFAHRDIAINGGILDSLNKARLEDKTRVDAGFIKVREDSLVVFDSSQSLDIELNPEVREKTADLFRKQSISHQILV